MPTPVILHPPGTPASQLPRIDFTVYVARYLGVVGGVPTWSAEVPEPSLAPEVLSWGSCGELTTLTLRYELGADPDGAFPQQAVEDARLLHGALISVVDPFKDPQEEWFRGYLGMDEILIQASPDRQTYKLIAYGPELALRNKAVSGQWHASVAVDDAEVQGTAEPSDRVRDNAFATDLPVVFNQPAGSAVLAQPVAANASPQAWNLASTGSAHGGAVFLASGRKIQDTLVEAVPWTACRALRSLVEWYDDYSTISPDETDWSAIEAVLGATPIGEVNVEGRGLLEAIREVLLPVGFGFALEPWSDANGKHALAVFSLKDPATKVTPYLAAAGTKMTSAAGKSAAVQRLHFALDSHNIRNSVTVIGDAGRIQVNLIYAASVDDTDLWPAWDTDADDLADYDAGSGALKHPLGAGNGEMTEEEQTAFLQKYDPQGGESPDSPHAFRSFVWNEDGAYCPFIGFIPNLHERCMIGSEGKWARRPRPVGPFFRYDDAAKVQTHSPEVWLVEPQSAIRVKVPAHVWRDRAGFTLDKPLIEISKDGIVSAWRPFAEDPAARERDATATEIAESVATLADLTFAQLLHNTVANAVGRTKIELQLWGSVEDDACAKGSLAMELTSPWPFTARRVERHANRFFKRTVIDDLGGTPDVRDDSADATDLASRIEDAEEDQLGHGSIMLPFVTSACPVGAGVSATAGRVIDLGVSAGVGTSTPVIRQVRWSMGEGMQTTELLLDSPLLRIGR